MTAPVVQGWCPGALRPMRSGDGLVVRVRPPGGRLTQEQAAGLAALARAHGNGLIDLSARANVQLRGVTEASHAPLIARLAGLGLLDADPDREARRNIVVTPFWGDGDAAPVIAAALAEALAADDAPATPGKFGYAVDTGPVPVLRDVSADIRIERGPHGLICRADTAPRGVPVTVETSAVVALDLARWFLSAGGAPEGRGRMAALLRRVDLPARFDGADLRDGGSAASLSAAGEDTGLGLLSTRRASPPAPGPTPAGVMVGLAFGQMHADTLAALAALGPLRVTPWRMLLLEGQAARPAIPGLITRADDPLRRVVACTGAPGCLQAHAATRPLARALAPHVPPGALLHVSGCAKGCAHPGPAALTLTATPGGFDLIRGGTAADPPVQTGLPAAALSRNPLILNGPA